MHIRQVASSDASEWLRMRSVLWPSSLDDHRRDIDDHLCAGCATSAVFVADLGGERLGGFLEVSTRSHAEGCYTSPVAYIEGWYVDSELRGQSVGRALMEAAESWARELGLSELASDTEIPNTGSIRAHQALGFEEVGRIAVFRKILGGAAQ